MFYEGPTKEWLTTITGRKATSLNLKCNLDKYTPLSYTSTSTKKWRYRPTYGSSTWMSYKLNLIHNRESVRWTNDIYGHTCMYMYDIIFVCVFGIRLDKVKHIFPLFETKVSGMICIFRRLWKRREKKTSKKHIFIYMKDFIRFFCAVYPLSNL